MCAGCVQGVCRGSSSGCVQDVCRVAGVVEAGVCRVAGVREAGVCRRCAGCVQGVCRVAGVGEAGVCRVAGVVEAHQGEGGPASSCAARTWTPAAAPPWRRGSEPGTGRSSPAGTPAGPQETSSAAALQGNTPTHLSKLLFYSRFFLQSWNVES